MLGQLNYFLKRNNIIHRFQSGFRAGHSTETALLRVSNDIFRGIDSGSCVVLLLLDLQHLIQLIMIYLLLVSRIVLVFRA